MSYTVNKQELEENINDWVYSNIDASFTFREYQFEQIVEICTNILEGINHTQIIEAPTGSGKSLLNIISAGVLADYYERKSYILVSDLYLWKQYEDFILKHRNIKKNFGIIKGQTGNYICNKNEQDMRNAECQMAGMSWTNMFNHDKATEMGFPCASTCKYIKDRKKALKSKVVIMTYQLYHFMINVVDKTAPDSKACFKRRDIIFCDECHNIPSIVKNCFTPEIKLSDFDFFKTLHRYRGNMQLELFKEDEEINNENYTLISDKISLADLEEKYYDLWNTFVNEHASKPETDKAIKDYHAMLEDFAETVKAIESHLSRKKQVFRENFTRDDIKFYKACSWYRNMCCLWSDFNTCVAHTGIDYVIKEISESRTLKEKIVTFSDVKEDFMCYYFLLSTCDNHVMMSATIGGYDAFAENIGVHYLEANFKNPDEEILFTIIPSTFDFSTSPIHFLNRYKMSYREKDKSLAVLKPMIYKLCGTQFKASRGMIQTGSYANAKEIFDNAPEDIKSRMLLYNNAKEKTNMITIHQMSKDTILIGPTLVEGIDLPGDACSFIIILKVPYPVITDEYVQRKIDLFPKWYNSTTSNTIIQGIGRGNRFKNDSCVTYILDACFLGLYNATKDQYPIELQERIKIYA